MGKLKDENPRGKFAVGNWLYTAAFDDILKVDNNGNPIKRHGNFGVYGFGEYKVYLENAEDTQGLSIFGRFGYARPNINRFQHYLGFGLVYQGLIPHRNEDQLGLAMAAAFNGRKYRKAQKSVGIDTDLAEINLELTYRMQITPWFSVQPNVQYTINPDTDPNLDNAFTLGSRFGFSF